MVVKPWPTTVPICPERHGVRGGPQDARVAFQPALGPPVVRRRTSVATETFNVPMSPWTVAQFQAFEAWFRDDLSMGVLSFGFPHPMIGVPRPFTFAAQEEGAYSVSQAPAGYLRVSFGLVGVAFAPWWAAYVPAGTGRVPYAVADYDNGIFGIEGAIATAAEVADVTGTFDVYTTDTGDETTSELNHVVAADDIPATAPGGVSRIIAYVP